MRTILTNSKRKRNKGSAKFEDQTYKNRGGIASMTKKDIARLLAQKYGHSTPEKLMKKNKMHLTQCLQQVQENVVKKTVIPIPELDPVEQI